MIEQLIQVLAMVAALATGCDQDCGNRAEVRAAIERCQSMRGHVDPGVIRSCIAQVKACQKSNRRG